MERLSKPLPVINVQTNKGTKKKETSRMPQTDRVILSMHQQAGEECVPVVFVGDSVKIGQVVARAADESGTPIHASISGKVVGMPKVMSWDGAVHSAMEIEADGEQVYYEGIKVPEVKTSEEFFSAIKDSGLVELSKTPEVAHSKFNTDNPGGLETLLISGAETGPYLTCDYRCMVEDTREIISGAKLLMKYLNIPTAHIAVERKNKKAIEALEKIIEAEELEGVISIELLDSGYPQGMPEVMIYNLMGLKLLAGDRPEDVGIMFTNVSTVAFLGLYFKTGIPLVSRRITVTGSAIADPKNIVVPIGARIADVVEACGGYSITPRKIVLGGALRGRAVSSDAAPVTKGTDGIIAFGEEDIIRKREGYCIKCGACRKNCPARLDPSEIRKALDKNDIERVQKLKVSECLSCGVCSFVCPARRHLTESMNVAMNVAVNYKGVE